MRRLLALLATAFAIGAVTVPMAVAAGADPVSSCTTSRGVLVVVDFRHFGGAVTRGCDVTITNGWNALQKAGFSVKGTQRYPTSFVCRINNRPTPQQDPCVNTPPTNAYWSYWHADAGRSTWTYSTRGAQDYQPPPGSIDAWVFGRTDVSGSQGGPTFTPAQARSGATSGGGGGGGGTGGGGGGAKPSPARHHGPAHRASGAPAPAGSGRPAGSTDPRHVPSGTTAPGATTSRSAAAGSSATRSPVHPLTAGGSAPAGSSGLQIVDATAEPAAKKSASGSALPVVLGLALALLLGGGAGWTVLRRRRAEAADH